MNQPVTEQLADYTDGETVFQAFVARPEGIASKTPTVLVLHQWTGPSAHTQAITVDIARRGYVAIALDVYGKGRRGTTGDECSALMSPLVEDRGLLERRLRAGVEFARGLDFVDSQRIAAVGHCFGGLCVLDMARHNLGLRSVVSLHGVLGAPAHGTSDPIGARVLILHGDQDPLAPSQDEIAIRRELTEREASWELQAYGHALHAFTVPGVSDPENGLQYHPVAARRANAAMFEFLAETLTAESA